MLLRHQQEIAKLQQQEDRNVDVNHLAGDAVGQADLYLRQLLPKPLCPRFLLSQRTEDGFAKEPLGTRTRSRARVALLSLTSSSQSLCSISFAQRAREGSALSLSQSCRASS